MASVWERKDEFASVWQIRPYADQKIVRLKGGEPFVEGIEAFKEVPGMPLVVLKFTIEEGEPVLDSFVVRRWVDRTDPSSPKKLPIQAAQINQLALDSLAREAVQMIVRHLALVEDLSDIDDDEIASGVTRTRRRRLLTDDWLRKVVRAAKEDDEKALPEGRPVAVSRALHTSPRNAARWITAAKERGLFEEEEAS